MKNTIYFLLYFLLVNTSYVIAFDLDSDLKLLNQQEKNNELYFLDGKIELKTSFRGYEFNIKAAGRLNPFVEERNYSVFQDVYLKKELDRFSFSVGQKSFNKKIFEGPDQLDILNPIVIDSSLVNPIKLGIPFTQIEYSSEKHVLSLNYLPYFISNQLPSEKSPINLPGQLQEKIVTNDSLSSDRSIDQYYFELSSYWLLVDTRLSYLRHVSVATPQLEIDNLQQVILNYLELENISLSFVKTFESWLLKSFLTSKRFTNSKYDNLNHSIWGVGYEAPFYFSSSLETTIYAEYTRVITNKEVEPSLLNVNQNDLFIGFRQPFDSLSNPELKVGVSVDTVLLDEHFFSVQYEQNFSPNTRFEVELVTINKGESKSSINLNINSLVPYAESDYLRLGLRIYL